MTGPVGISRREASDRLPAVFVDTSGRRLRRLRVAAFGAGTACTAYLCILGVAVTAGQVNPFAPFGLPGAHGAQAWQGPSGQPPEIPPGGAGVTGPGVVGDGDATAPGEGPVQPILAASPIPSDARLTVIGPASQGSAPDAAAGPGRGVDAGVSAGGGTTHGGTRIDVDAGTSAGGDDRGGVDVDAGVSAGTGRTAASADVDVSVDGGRKPVTAEVRVPEARRAPAATKPTTSAATSVASLSSRAAARATAPSTPVGAAAETGGKAVAGTVDRVTDTVRAGQALPAPLTP